VYNKILVPLDGSEISETVIPYARIFAGLNNSEIILIRVSEYPCEIYSELTQFHPLDPRRAEFLKNKKEIYHHEIGVYLEEIAKKIRTAELKVNIKICEGPVVQGILAVIEKMGIDVVIMSAFGSSGSSTNMIGAVADRILFEAKVPVMVIRAEQNPMALNKSIESSSNPREYVQRSNLYLPFLQT
jgi:nucleotide-binding universal stress UspA family protein